MKNYKEEERYQDKFGYEIVIVDLNNNESIMSFWVKGSKNNWGWSPTAAIGFYSLDEVDKQIQSKELKKYLKGDAVYPNNYAAKIVRCVKEFEFWEG